jgi:hypothetical protein
LPPGVVINDPRNLEFVLKNEGIFSKGDFFKRRSWDLFGKISSGQYYHKTADYSQAMELSILMASCGKYNGGLAYNSSVTPT